MTAPQDSCSTYLLLATTPTMERPCQSHGGRLTRLCTARRPAPPLTFSPAPTMSGSQWVHLAPPVTTSRFSLMALPFPPAAAEATAGTHAVVIKSSWITV